MDAAKPVTPKSGGTETRAPLAELFRAFLRGSLSALPCLARGRGDGGNPDENINAGPRPPGEEG